VTLPLIGATLLAALAIDRALGEPPAALHPVVGIGRLIAAGRGWVMRTSAWRAQLRRGAVLALGIPAVTAALAWVAQRAVVDGIHAAVRAAPPLAAAAPYLLVAALAALLKPLFAVRALVAAAQEVRAALAAGDLARARYGLRSLCSRDAAELDEAQLLAAAIESVAENTSDSVVAPLGYFAAFGLPGAAFYRAANTLDAMIGYRGRYEWAGKVAARLDDLLNLLPARITAAGFVALAPLVGGHPGAALATWWRDAGRTASPNAGRPMAAMAGALGVCLDKPGHYQLGVARHPLRLDDLDRACRLAALTAWASGLGWGLAALLAGAALPWELARG
jgi:adenosylcobinamide-phosphate synthase